MIELTLVLLLLGVFFVGFMIGVAVMDKDSK